MSRFSRIKTIWRKELVDTLRDRRTLVAMIVVPMILYPVLMLGSVQAIELQQASVQRSEFTIGVADEPTAIWLWARISSDPSRRTIAADIPAEELPDFQEKLRAASPAELLSDEDGEYFSQDEREEAAARARPYRYRLRVMDDVRGAVTKGDADVGVVVSGGFPSYASEGNASIAIVFDATSFRGMNARAGLIGLFERLQERMLETRLRERGLDEQFLKPIALEYQNVATEEQTAGYALGMFLPLILITMTITGAIYPAIDLTAGERERGTLETLMVAPVPTVDLIAGKFVVVAFIGMLSATLNLLSMGLTIHFGGLGEALFQGGPSVAFPLRAIPLVLLVMIPLAVLFSAVLLVVCSFARSFKEAQNYIMPVMIAALIPAMIAVLPGTELEGPMLVLPVANIVLLTRELFVNSATVADIVVVTASTTLYAAAAMAVAAKLFGQEAVLFADSRSIRAMFVRKFFERRPAATVSQVLMVLAFVYVTNFFIQQSLPKLGALTEGVGLFVGVAIVLVALMGVLPIAVSWYLRLDRETALGFARPQPLAFVAALCFGSSTWILARYWAGFQARVLPMLPEMETAMKGLSEQIEGMPILLCVLLLAVVPGVVEEIFFRGFALAGLKRGLNATAAVLLTAFAFAMFHHSIHRFVITFGLGLLLGLLALRSGAIWPTMIAHTIHNSLSLLAERIPLLNKWLQSVGVITSEGAVTGQTALLALAVTLFGVLLCLLLRERRSADGLLYAHAAGSA